MSCMMNLITLQYFISQLYKVPDFFLPLFFFWGGAKFIKPNWLKILTEMCLTRGITMDTLHYSTLTVHKWMFRN